MQEKVELFYQTLKFTPWIGVVDALAIAHFFVHWYRSAKRTGWKIDFWYANLFFSCFLNICLLYPFCASVYQMPMTIGHYEVIVPFVDQAFLISLLGYACMWVGRSWCDRLGESGVVGRLFSLLNPLSGMIERNVKSKKGVVAIALVAAIFGLWLFSLQFGMGEFFNLRTHCLRDEMLRPFFNFVTAFFPLALAFLALRSLCFREKWSMLFFIFLLVLSLFFGMRSTSLLGLLFFILFYLYQRRGRLSWWKFLPVCALLFVAAVYINLLRHDVCDPLQALQIFFFEIFYGNNFSDTRDFAWLLAFWDGEYFYGKTYLAGALSFIPRAWSELRQEWGFSIITNGWIGFDSDEMPGLRPGTFGETFFNFGLIGVMLYGFVLGYALRLADVRIKQAVEEHGDLIKGYAQTIVFTLLLQVYVSSGLWGLHFLVLTHLMLALFRKTLWRSVVNPLLK